ncbi:helix-turn-helix transcriptional regulator [Catellatospora sp. NPDC049609]|uniref:helix-turn-helix domain-containing protein n=1 Tax=Catellatospora sp. NPDC049609 TaxID=3155505 RepID=UPI003423EE2D
MTAVDPLGRLIAQRRRQLGKSQERLAEQMCLRSGRATITKNEVSRYERGERVPSADSLRLLADVLGLPLEGLERAAAVSRGRRHRSTPEVSAPRSTVPPPVGETGPHREVNATERREMLRQLAAASLVVAGWPVGAAHGAELPSRITPEHVAELREAANLYRQWVRRHGGGGLGRHISALLERATLMHGAAVTEQTRGALLRCLADLAGLGAYVARDVEAHGYASQLYRLALQAAQAAGDRHLGGHLIVRMAGHNIELRRPEDTLVLLGAAQQAARSVLSRGERANQYCIEAWAGAQRGDVEAVRRAVGRAEDEFGRADAEGMPEWAGQHVTESELYSLTGAGYVELARTDARHAAAAAERLRHAIALRGTAHARNRTLDQLSLAEALLIGGEREEAVRVADQALDQLESITSGRLRRRLIEVGSTFTRHGAGDDAVTEWRTRLAAAL